jgi:hypothetical protein
MIQQPQESMVATSRRRSFGCARASWIAANRAKVVQLAVVSVADFVVATTPRQYTKNSDPCDDQERTSTGNNVATVGRSRGGKLSQSKWRDKRPQ